MKLSFGTIKVRIQDFSMTLCQSIVFYGLFILLARPLAKNLANAIFGECDFFQDPKVALGKNPLYFKNKLTEQN